MPRKTSAEEWFASTAEHLAREPEVEEGSAFYSPGLKVRGKIFAMLVKGELVVKLPAERVDGWSPTVAAAPSSPAAA